MSTSFEKDLRAALQESTAGLPQTSDPYARVAAGIAANRRRRRAMATGVGALVLIGVVATGAALLNRTAPTVELTPGGATASVPESGMVPTDDPAVPVFTEGLGGAIVVRSCADPAAPWTTTCPPDWADTAGQKGVRLAVADIFEVDVNDVAVEVLFDADLPTDALPEGSSAHAIVYHATLRDGRQVRATDILVYEPGGGAHQPPTLEEVSSPALPVVSIDPRHDSLTPPLVITPGASALTITHTSGDRLVAVERVAAEVSQLSWLLSVMPDWTVLEDSDFTVTLDDGTQQTFPGTEVMDERIIRRPG